MRKTIAILEHISQWSGWAFATLCIALVAVLTLEVFMRYVLSSPTQFSYEIASSMGVAIGAGGLAYTHLHGGHVRVDVLWKNLSPKGRAISDIVCALLFLFPLFIFLTIVSISWAQQAVIEHEIMTTTYWYPPAWPTRSMMALGLFLLLPQGVAELLRNICILKGMEVRKVGEL